MSKKKLPFSEGDIVTLTNGDMFRIIEMTFPEMIKISRINKDDYDFIVNTDTLYVESVLSATPESLFMFNSIKSIHLRLNRFNNL